MKKKMHKKPPLSEIISEVEKNFKNEDDYIKKINLDYWLGDSNPIYGHQIVVICGSGRHFSLQTWDNILWMKERWNQRLDKAIELKKWA